MTDVRDAMLVAKDSNGTLIRRPLSPHAGIYRWPITMVASILNRITGVAISVGTLLLVWWLVAAASGASSFALVQEFLISPLGLLLLFGWTLALFYHFWSGIRHLAWDMGFGFAKAQLNPATWVVLALTLVSTAAVWAVAYGKLGG
jgi:succinate dehydrogenase / fumarate reductase cytochrome b subunit